jgi:hypothetical protein
VNDRRIESGEAVPLSFPLQEIIHVTPANNALWFADSQLCKKIGDKLSRKLLKYLYLRLPVFATLLLNQQMPALHPHLLTTRTEMETSRSGTHFLGQLKTDTVANCIGATPLVRLNRVPASLGIKAQVYAKLEYFNAGGSVKDRIAKRMIEKAEQNGIIKPGDTLIEASSGNTWV